MNTDISLLSGRALALVWVPLLLVGLLHYGTPTRMELHWVHDVARRLYYVPILLGGALGGVRGGLVVTGAVLLFYSPHAWHPWFGPDPASPTQKLLESGFYVVLGLLSGLISDRSRREAQQQVSLLERLREQDAELMRASRLGSLGALTAGLAHEIRNPLHAMRGTAEVVLDVVPKEVPQRPLAEALLTEIDRLDAILRRFLDFARHQPPEVERVLLAEVITHVSELIRTQASRQGTTLHTDTTIQGEVFADAQQIIQVVMSLCINGMQALGQGGNLWMSVVEEGAERGIMVSNDGPVISAEMKERIFDPFVSTRDTGVGLGLAIAWRIIDSHGGRLAVEDRTGGGVCFTLRLPIA
ncbi:MAG: signal transduction histidine kinase [Myxococcota bacterium]|jgi:signal transduction histidine kinase